MTERGWDKFEASCYALAGAILLWSTCSAVIPEEGPPVSVEDLREQEYLEVFWRASRAIRAELGLSREEVKVSLVSSLHGYLGLTMIRPEGVLLVAVERDLDGQARLDVLIHEWAHAAVAGACQEESHDAMWGVAYARCYRAHLRGPPPAKGGAPGGGLPEAPRREGRCGG